MFRLTAVLAILLTGAAVAAAALIQGQSGRSERITGTNQVDRILAGRGDDVVFARDQRADYVNCGPGQDVAVVDHVDRTRGCETKRYPPKPTAVAPSPTGLVKAGPRGSITPLPRKSCLHRRRGCPPPPPPPDPDPEPPPEPGPTPSGQAMPVGDLPGWRQVFTEDFPTDVASWGDCTSFAAGRDCPGLPAVYRAKWWSYPSSYQDTREKIAGDGGFYRPANYSMSGGLLHLPLRRVAGTSQSAAPVPKIPGAFQTYGRYAIRFRTTSSSTFKVAWLLNPSTAAGADEEIDFPEADLDSSICAFNHGPSGANDFINCSGPPIAGAWHTAVTEWTPGRLRFFLDGQLFGETTNQVSSVGMTWVIQSETVLGGALAANASADIDIDWVAIWSRV